MESALCPNCGEDVGLHYCPGCGQKRTEATDFSPTWFLREFFESLTNLESRVWRSIWVLIRHPGQMTLDYFEGRRQRYLKPIQLFLLANVWFFLIQGVTHISALTTPLRTHLRSMPYREMMRPVVADRIALSGLTPAAFEVRLDEVMAEEAKTLVFAMVPMFALCLWLVVWQRRHTFVHHLVFATHFFTLMMVVAPLCIVGIGISPISTGLKENLLSLAFGTLMLVAIRRAYQMPWWRSVLTSMVAIVGLMVVIQLYRLLLLNAGLLAMRSR